MIEYRYSLGDKVYFTNENKVDTGTIKTFIHKDYECYGIVSDKDKKLKEVHGNNVMSRR